AICSGCWTTGCFADAGDAELASRCPRRRTAGSRRRARVLLRKLESARIRGGRHRRRLRAGQSFALRPRRAARAALSDRARAGKARPRHRGRGTRCRGRPAQKLADVWTARRGRALVGEPADAVDSSRLRARVHRRFRGRRVPLQDDRLLVPGARAHAALERPRARDRLARSARAGARAARRRGNSARRRRLLSVTRARATHGTVPRILVTGAAGQLGRELATVLAPLGDVVALDRSGLDLARPDDIVAVLRDVAPALVVNAAAYTAVDRAEAEPDAAFAVNARAPGILAAEARRLDALVIHYSTDYVFDGASPEPRDEAAPARPLNVYGASKLEGERAIEA